MVKWVVISRMVKWVVIKTSTERRGGTAFGGKSCLKNDPNINKHLSCVITNDMCLLTFFYSYLSGPSRAKINEWAQQGPNK